MIPLLGYTMLEQFLFWKVQCALNKTKLERKKKSSIPKEKIA